MRFSLQSLGREGVAGVEGGLYVKLGDAETGIPGTRGLPAVSGGRPAASGRPSPLQSCPGPRPAWLRVPLRGPDPSGLEVKRAPTSFPAQTLTAMTQRLSLFTGQEREQNHGTLCDQKKERDGAVLPIGARSTQTRPRRSAKCALSAVTRREYLCQDKFMMS